MSSSNDEEDSKRLPVRKGRQLEWTSSGLIRRGLELERAPQGTSFSEARNISASVQPRRDDDPLLEQVVSLIRTRLRNMKENSRTNPKEYGSPPEDVFLIEYTYRAPAEPEPTARETPQNPELKTSTRPSLSRKIQEGFQQTYDNKRRRTPPDMHTLPISQCWKVTEDTLSTVSVDTIRSMTESLSEVIRDLVKRQGIHVHYPVVVAHFSVTGDGAELYMDMQWAPLAGGGDTYDVVREGQGIRLIPGMWRWRS